MDQVGGVGHVLAVVRKQRNEEGNVITILLVVLLLMMIGVVPAWPHSRDWGYMPSGTLGLLLIILLVLALTGRI
jgi:peptidoglycan/LPS O-acetylase OafA/YrhL